MFDERSFSLPSVGVLDIGCAKWFTGKFKLPFVHYHVWLIFVFHCIFVNANSWFGPYPIVGSNARYLYQTNLNGNAILA